MPVDPSDEVPLIRQLERDIVEGEIRVAELNVLISTLRARGQSTADVERTLDGLEAEVIEMWARRATFIQEANRHLPKGKLS